MTLHFDVPDNKYELLGIESSIELIKTNLNRFHELLYDVRINYLRFIDGELNKLADLSIPIFDLRIKMERDYINTYGKKIGRKLFIKHYEKLHEPYDKLKEEIFTLFMVLDPMNKGFN